jgi:antitoxin component YwqK of YwqJK toxin-antitoxin module
MSRTSPLVGVLLFSLCACGIGYRNGAAEQRPEIITGMGGTVMYPGEAGPAMPGSAIGPAGSTSSNSTSSAPGTTSGSSTSNGSGVPSQGAPSAGSGGAPQSGSSTGAPAQAPGSNMMMIGQTTEEASQSEEKKLFLPIGPLFGYPFWIFGQTLGQKADEAKKEQMEPKPAAAKPVPSGPDDVERDKLVRENEALRQELERRAQPAPAQQSAAPHAAIGDELASLERSLGHRAAATTAPAPVAAGTGAPTARPILPVQPGLGAPVASDRNGDGKPDMWVYSMNGRPVTEALDDDFDGRVDRIRHLDEKGRLVSSDDDLNGDGIMETTSIYENGLLVRRRTDSDGDGQADTWSFYKGDELLRTEIDKNGDGFRDEITIYEHGQIARVEIDKNGDGRPDVVSIYVNGQLDEKREDLDFDGIPDVVSHYKNGKLASREASSTEVFEKWQNDGAK